MVLGAGVTAPAPAMVEHFRCDKLKMKLSRASCATYHVRWNSADQLAKPGKQPCTGCPIGVSHRRGGAHPDAPSCSSPVAAVTQQPAAKPKPKVAEPIPSKAPEPAPTEAPVASYATAPATPRAIVEQRVEATGRHRERACEDCSKLFKPAPGRGMPPLRCPECKAKPKTPRRKLATEVGRTETRTCDLSTCGKTFTHTATRGAIPRYCTPECARRAENDARRERERLARIDQGMAPRPHLIRTEVVEMSPSPEPEQSKPDILAIMLECEPKTRSVLDEQREIMQRMAAHRERLVLEIASAEGTLRALHRALEELDGDAPDPVRGAYAVQSDGSVWGVVGGDESDEELRKSLSGFLEKEPVSTHAFEVLRPVHDAASAIALVKAAKDKSRRYRLVCFDLNEWKLIEEAMGIKQSADFSGWAREALKDVAEIAKYERDRQATKAKASR